MSSGDEENGVDPPLKFPLSDRHVQLIDDKALQQHLLDSLPSTSSPITSNYRENEDLDALLTEELETPVLNEIEKYLMYIASPSSADIESLHEQAIKSRYIVVAENCGLHLVWYYTTIFVKPIPPMLLNFTFWKECLLPQNGLDDSKSNPAASSARTSYSVESLSAHCKAALGFLRTYAVLVHHESDFLIAKDKHLIPDGITYSQFQAFIKPFLSIPEAAVTARYHYGQIRLTRLNWVVRFVQPRSHSTGGWLANRWYYQELYSQSGDYVSKYGPPLLFIFAVLSLILSSMQVVIAAQVNSTWHAFIQASWGFSVATILLCTALAVVPILFFPLLWLMQLTHVLNKKRKKLAGE